MDYTTVATIGTAISSFIGVIVGGAITVLTNYFLERIKQNAKYGDKLFELRLDFYLKYMKVLNKGYTTLTHTTNPLQKNRFPIAYQDHKSLLDWHKLSVGNTDESLILIDKSVIDKFQKLNAMVINHLAEIDNKYSQQSKDQGTITIGQRDCDKIVEATAEVANGIIVHLNKSYDLNISRLELFD